MSKPMDNKAIQDVAASLRKAHETHVPGSGARTCSSTELRSRITST